MFNLQKAIIPTPQKVTDKKGTVKIADITKSNFTLTSSGNGEVFLEAVSYLKSAFRKKAMLKDFEGDIFESPEFGGSDFPAQLAGHEFFQRKDAVIGQAEAH